MGAETTFTRMFQHVDMLGSMDEFESRPLTLLITPQIREFAVSQGLAATLYLDCKLVDKAGDVVYENTIPTNGEGQAATGCLLGVWGGKMALSKTATDAFNKAFGALASDIRQKVDFTPYM
ncbi:MAG: hypothetical protein JSW58_16600 [Candidatus Latescibacterota bacterium]|nr:MAG: hypothetical protein JSW58_16600 [Candidatus Latescibacterota bacterium]